MKMSGNFLKYRYHGFRKTLVQPFFWALCFLGPLMDVFRLDMINQKLIFMGERYPFEVQYLMWLPIGFYAIVILIAFISFVWGRLFCGWTCPHDTLTEWTRPLRAMMGPLGRQEKPRWMKMLLREHPPLEKVFYVLGPFLGLLLTIVQSVLLSFYVVPPDWIAAQYASGSPHVALIFGHVLFSMLGFFLLFAGHDFCRTCCPYGMAQSLSAYHEGSRWQSMEIEFNGDKVNDCKTCTACQTMCPVDLDPRDPSNLKVGQFYGCFNCGECIDACKFIHEYRQEPGLLSFKKPGMKKKEAVTASAKQCAE